MIGVRRLNDGYEMSRWHAFTGVSRDRSRAGSVFTALIAIRSVTTT